MSHQQYLAISNFQHFVCGFVVILNPFFLTLSFYSCSALILFMWAVCLALICHSAASYSEFILFISSSYLILQFSISSEDDSSGVVSIAIALLCRQMTKQLFMSINVICDVSMQNLHKNW